MDTKCVEGILIKLTLWINFENWKRNFETLESKLKNRTDGKISKNLKIFEKLETKTPVFESV